MMRFLNLTNGIEWLTTGQHFDGYVRIESTACEQKRWGAILDGLDYGFLLALAAGEEVEVVDYSARDRRPRALWQGLPWVEMAINDAWFGHRHVATITARGGALMLAHMAETLDTLPKADLRRIRYCRRFIAPGLERVHLLARHAQTDHDGDYPWYREVLMSHHCVAA